MKLIKSLLLSLALLVGLTSSEAQFCAAPAGTPPPSLTFSIQRSGNQLVDGSGNPVQFHGSNASGMEQFALNHSPWSGNGLGNAEPNWTLFKSWNNNAVRIPLNESSWLDLTGTRPDNLATGYYAGPASTYKAAIQNAVNHATAAGLYVILDLHWSAPGPYIAVDQSNGANRDHSVAFWTSVATMFKANPAVIFELYNEPYLLFTWPESFAEWDYYLNGGGPNGGGYFATGYYSVIHLTNNNIDRVYNWQAAGTQEMLNAIRATGAKNVVLVNGLSYASVLGWVQNGARLQDYMPTDTLSPHQLGIGWHTYANSTYPTYENGYQSDRVTTGGPSVQGYGYANDLLAAGYPIIITEYGGPTTGATPPLLPYMWGWADGPTQSGIDAGNGNPARALVGYMAWTWDNWACPPACSHVLLNSSTATPTPALGAAVKAHYLTRH